MTTTVQTRIKKPIKKWHGNCIYKIREVNSPLQKNFRGFRMVVAVPNMNGHKPFSSEPAASFTRSYLLFQSSDWGIAELEQKTQGAIRFLLNRGFTKVEPAEVFEERMKTEMAKGKKLHHVEHEEV